MKKRIFNICIVALLLTTIFVNQIVSADEDEDLIQNIVLPTEFERFSGQQLSFRVELSEIVENIENVTFSFGDGTIVYDDLGNNLFYVHTYQWGGVFNGWAYVKANDGRYDLDYFEINIEGPDKPDFTIDNPSVIFNNEKKYLDINFNIDNIGAPFDGVPDHGEKVFTTIFVYSDSDDPIDDYLYYEIVETAYTGIGPSENINVKVYLKDMNDLTDDTKSLTIIIKVDLMYLLYEFIDEYNEDNNVVEIKDVSIEKSKLINNIFDNIFNRIFYNFEWFFTALKVMFKI